MLRRILISLGLLIAFLPYLGFPHSWQAIISTVAGLIIVTLLLFSRRGKVRRGLVVSPDQHDDESKALHVEHVEIEDRPEVHVEREVVIDSAALSSEEGVKTTVEKKVTVERRRRKTDIPEVNATQVD